MSQAPKLTSHESVSPTARISLLHFNRTAIKTTTLTLIEHNVCRVEATTPDNTKTTLTENQRPSTTDGENP